MANLNHFGAFLATAGLLLAAGGCESGTSALAPVHGTVAYRGTPLPCGTIVFTPDLNRGNGGALARGEIQANGSFVLRTGDADGVQPGWHRVTVVAVQAPAGSSAGQHFVMPRSLVPEKYRDPEMSGLTCEVKAGHENKVDFNLE